MVTITPILVGSAADDGAGSPVRSAGQIINANFTALAAASVASTSNSTTAGQAAFYADTSGQNLSPFTASGYVSASSGVLSASTTIPITAISGVGSAAKQTAFWYNAKDYGVKGDYASLTGITTTATSATISSSAYNFVAGDVGKHIAIPGAGAGGAALTTTISNISGVNAVLAVACSTSIMGSGTANFATDDTANINAAIVAVNAAGGGFISFPAGIYSITGNGTASDGCIQMLNNVTLVGAGRGVTIFRLFDNYTALGNIGITGLIRTPSGVSNSHVGLECLSIDGNLAYNAYNPTYSNRIIGFYCGVTPDIPCTAALTLSSSTVTATVASTSSLTNGQTVSFYNVQQSQYFGDQIITSIPNSTTFTFTVSGTPATPSTSQDNGLPFFYPTSAALASDYDIYCFSVEVVNCNYYGFDPHERTTRLRLFDCIGHYNGTDGLVLDYNIDAQVSNCNFSYNGRHGINVTTTSTNCQGVNNICEFNGFGTLGQPGHGIVMQRGIGHIPFPTLNNFTGGSYNNNYGNGVLLSLADYNTVSNYSAYNNGEQNTRLFGSRYNSIVNPIGQNPSANSLGTYDEVNVSDYYINLTSLTQTGGVATGTYTNHNLNVGDEITIIGATQSGYNLTNTPVLSVPSTSTFTYAVSSGTVSPATTSSNIQVFALYYAASYNSITGIQSTSTASNARYGLKEETSTLGSGYNSYNITAILGASSGIYELENASSSITGTIGANGLTTTQAQQNIGVIYGYQNISSSTSTSVTPGASIINCAFTAANQTLNLYPMNVATSPQKGTDITITNDGAYSFTLYAQDGSTSLFSNLAPGKQVVLQVTSNSTANGSFNRVYITGSGIKAVSTSTYSLSNPGDNQNFIIFSYASGCASAAAAVSTFPYGFTATLKNTASGSAIFTPNSGDSIDGASSLTIVQNASYTIEGDQATWHIKSAYIP